MSFLKWDNSFSVNIAEIDDQHQGLVEMINELHSAMRQRKTKDILGKIIDNLMDYTKYHFATEEKYFDRFNYPETNSHKDEHLNFIEKVNEFRDDFRKNKAGLSVEVLYFLTDWLQQHIKSVDKKYGIFFNRKGLR